MVGKILGHF